MASGGYWQFQKGGESKKHHRVGMGTVYGMCAVLACSAVLLLWGGRMGYTYPFLLFFFIVLAWLAEGS